MLDDVSPRQPVTRHPLFLSWGGFTLRMSDQGIAPDVSGLQMVRQGEVITRPYADIAEVNLSMSPAQKSAPVAQMIIRFRNGERLRVQNTAAWGNVDADQTQHYYRFKADLHDRLIASGAAGRIRFTSGYTEARAQAAKVVMAIAAAFFVGGPIVIYAMTGQAQALIICLAGVAFVIPLFRASSRNEPGSYDPRNPPDMLA